jgi:hypothetical protein
VFSDARSVTHRANHHSVNLGVVTEFCISWLGATRMIPNTCANIARMLKLNGNNTRIGSFTPD